MASSIHRSAVTYSVPHQLQNCFGTDNVLEGIGQYAYAVVPLTMEGIQTMCGPNMRIPVLRSGIRELQRFPVVVFVELRFVLSMPQDVQKYHPDASF